MCMTMPNAYACDMIWTCSSGTGCSMLYLGKDCEAGLVRQDGLEGWEPT